MISGESAVKPVLTMRASGTMPSSAALVSDMTTTAAAPSLSGQQLPAVTVPSGRNTGCSAATPSIVTPGRIRSITQVPFARPRQVDLQTRPEFQDIVRTLRHQLDEGPHEQG